MNATVDWLMAGDPVIRWQSMRDLCDAPPEDWQSERQLTTQFGWGALFLEKLGLDLQWPEGRWTGTVWTFLTVMDCGLPPDHPQLQTAARQFIDRMLPPERAFNADWLMTRIDLCHLGFWLRIGSYFLGSDTRMTDLAEIILKAQMPDGGWNCRKRNYPKTNHSSFHTTFNILEGLSQANRTNIISKKVFRDSEARALEFMLAHHMYRSDRTGEVVDERFLHLAFPSHWHYTILRGLDYMRNCDEIHDKRLDDPIAQIVRRQNDKGRWPVEKRIPGATHFDMEKMGGESRWNTLRVLRVLREQSNSPH